MILIFIRSSFNSLTTGQDKDQGISTDKSPPGNYLSWGREDEDNGKSSQNTQNENNAHIFGEKVMKWRETAYRERELIFVFLKQQPGLCFMKLF